jgi:chaperonin GroES
MSSKTADDETSDDAPPPKKPRRVVRHIRPLGMRILVKLIDTEERTASGLYLPQGVAEKHQDALFGEVIEVARTAEDDESLGENVSGVPAGARVLIPKDSGVAVPWDAGLRIVETAEVLATVEEVPYETVN